VIVSCAISIKDEDDLPSGHKRKKRGDIIAIKPVGWKWGLIERKRFLIVNVDLGTKVNTIEEAQKLTIPLFSDDTILWYPGSDDTQPTVVAYRRYKVPETTLQTEASKVAVTVDWDKVMNPLDEYQPIESKVVPMTVVFDTVKAKAVTEQDLTDMQNLDKFGVVKKGVISGF